MPLNNTLPPDFQFGPLVRVRSGNSPGGGGRRPGMRASGQPAMTRLGLRLRQLRREKDMRQKDVAELVGTVAGRISDWERGFHLPTLIVLHRYAVAFDMTVSELLKGVM